MSASAATVELQKVPIGAVMGMGSELHSKRLHIAWLPSIGALPARDAAAYLGVCYNTLWRRSNLPKKDPRRIRKTAYGTYWIEELNRHLKEETERS